ncbi:MAG: aminotransferase class I/II-fold pyridoxal phosphate-dependent enzyme, partial [Fibrobacteres bacterium]|nr:aminotransferase class I/II-fold pyridoxal phosphate-dependent enzyme [Fibrobacterota bacterium]
MKKRITNISGITPELLRPIDGDLNSTPSWLNFGRAELFLRGKSALYYGFSSLGLKPGDEVLVPAFICKTVTEPLQRAGAVVIFFNVSRDFSIDWTSVEQLVSKKTKALVMYHFLGLPFNIREAEQFCKRHRIRFIEDAAHGLFSSVDGRPAGSIGDSAILSLRKCIPMSFGAALIVNKSELPLAPPPETAVALPIEAECYWQERARYLHQIGWQNINKALPVEMPLYSYHAAKLTKYFNNDATHSPLDSESLLVMHNCVPEKVKSAR